MSVDALDDQLLVGGLGGLSAVGVDHLLRDLLVTHVVVCGRADQPHVTALQEAAASLDVAVHLVAVADSGGEDLAGHFGAASAFVAEATSEELNRVLVCCREGASRSVAVMVAHLMRSRGFPLRKAFDMVAAVRWRLWPNMGFIEQLAAYIPAGEPRGADAVCLSEAEADREAVVGHLACHAVWATARHNGKALTKAEAAAAWARAGAQGACRAARLEAAKLDVLGLVAAAAEVPSVEEVTEVVPGLFLGGLGGLEAAEVRELLGRHGLRRLVVCGSGARDAPYLSACEALPGVTVHVCCLPQPDLLAHTEAAALARAAAFVGPAGAPLSPADTQQASGAVLVACSKGASRSASVVMAVLMERGRSLLQAFCFLASKRWRLWPNWRLVSHLLARDVGDDSAQEVWRHIGAYSAMATCWHNGTTASMEQCLAAWDRRSAQASWATLAPEKRFLAVKEEVMGVGDLDSYVEAERPHKCPRREQGATPTFGEQTCVRT